MFQLSRSLLGSCMLARSVSNLDACLNWRLPTLPAVRGWLNLSGSPALSSFGSRRRNVLSFLGFKIISTNKTVIVAAPNRDIQCLLGASFNTWLILEPAGSDSWWPAWNGNRQTDECRHGMRIAGMHFSLISWLKHYCGDPGSNCLPHLRWLHWGDKESCG